MSVEYLHVVYKKGSLTVLADGDPVGVTNHTLMLPAGEYDVTLDGTGYAPTDQSVTLTDTSIMSPEIITFT